MSNTGWDLLKYNLFSNANPLIYEIVNSLIISRLDKIPLLQSLTNLLQKPKLIHILAYITTLDFERRQKKKIKL
jgi:hypothetical protein